MIPHFDFKVVVAGPFAAGKTTMISAISDDPIVGTEAPTSGGEAAVKATTTVGMEFGTLKAMGDDFSVELNVYGVPGQDRFQFMWDIVGVGMDGLFLLVDGSNPAGWAESGIVGGYFLERFGCPVVIGVNRAADRPDLVEAVRAELPIEGATYLGFDATDRDGARDALVELLLVVFDALPDDEVDDFDDGIGELGEPELTIVDRPERRTGEAPSGRRAPAADRNTSMP